jgi:hypothetical protein
MGVNKFNAYTTMPKVYFLFVFALFSNHIFSQKLEEVNEIDFALKVIRTGYPAYNYDLSLAKKFETFYQNTSRRPVQDTFAFVSNLYNFFNDSHFSITDYNFRKTIDSAASSEKFSKLLKQEINFANSSSVEGFWIDDYNSCIIGIYRDAKTKRKYRGFVIESIKKTLYPGTEILSFSFANGELRNCYYLSAFYRNRYYAESRTITNKNTIVLPWIKWRRLNNYSLQKKSLALYTPYTFDASYKILDSTTFYISIPTNDAENTIIVDSIVKTQDSAIRKSKTLIIDIRNNSGGRRRTYYALMPYIQTNEIIRDTDYRFCNSFYLQYYIDLKEEKLKKKDSALMYKIDSMTLHIKSNMNKFVYQSPDTFRVPFYTARPKNVAIIANYGTTSAAELMILDCIQSTKVKIFGEPTHGATDNLDAYSIITPKKYTLSIPTVIRKPNNKKLLLEGKGYQPGIIIPDSVSNWINYVKKFYED